MTPKNQQGNKSQISWWMGVIEDRMDPILMGRVRVRIFGYHTDDLSALPSNKLPWAQVLIPPPGIVGGIGQSPLGLKEGMWVLGLFLDGPDAQEPVVWGVLPGIAGTARDGSKGFADTRASATGFPGGKLYPESSRLNEPDVNRLARNEGIAGTASYTKTVGRVTGIPSVGGSWAEPENPYGAQYPFNHVLETESGHVQEFDDTPGAERINTWHKSGTYDEIGPAGDRTLKTVGDRYDVTVGDQYEKSKARIISADSLTIKVGGSTVEITPSGVTITSGGTLNVNGTAINITASGALNLSGATINLN